MLMGFISFLLTVGQKPISKICIPEGIAYSMLPCQKEESTDTGSDQCSEQVDNEIYPRHIVHGVFEFSSAIRGYIDRVTLFDIIQDIYDSWTLSDKFSFLLDSRVSILLSP